MTVLMLLVGVCLGRHLDVNNPPVAALMAIVTIVCIFVEVWLWVRYL